MADTFTVLETSRMVGVSAPTVRRWSKQFADSLSTTANPPRGAGRRYTGREDKLEAKHSVTIREVRQVLGGAPRIRFVEKGHIRGEDIYSAFGQTYSGRYLAVFFVHKPDCHTAIVISARDMTCKERRRYGRK